MERRGKKERRTDDDLRFSYVHPTTRQYARVYGGSKRAGLAHSPQVCVKLAGWYYSDVGELNQVVHIWAFRDHDHMAEAKAKIAQDPDWTQKYVPRVRPHIVAQKTYVMLSPDFAPQPQ